MTESVEPLYSPDALGKRFLMNTNMTGFSLFTNIFAGVCLGPK